MKTQVNMSQRLKNQQKLSKNPKIMQRGFMVMK